MVVLSKIKLHFFIKMYGHSLEIFVVKLKRIKKTRKNSVVNPVRLLIERSGRI